MMARGWYGRLIVGAIATGAGAIASAVVLGSGWAILTGFLAGNAVVCSWCAFGIHKLRQRFKAMGVAVGGPPTG